MLTAKCKVLACIHRQGVSQKTGKPYDGYDCQLAVEGYNLAWRAFIFANSLNGTELVPDMIGIVKVDVDFNFQPRIVYQFG